MADADAYTPEWWRDRLLPALDTQAKRVARLEKYYDHGFDILPTPPQGMNAEVYAEAKAAFENLSQLGVTNYARMIAQAPMERLSVQGFRLGDLKSKAAQKRSDQAWALWQANQLDSEFPLALETTFVTGQSYGMVWPADSGPSAMTCEHPGETIVAYEAGSRRKRAAALRRWITEAGRLRVNLYMPAKLFKWQSASAIPAIATLPMDSQPAPWDDRPDRLYVPASFAAGLGSWEECPGDNEPFGLPNPLGVVNVIEFAINTGLRARPFGGGVGQFEPVLSILNRINKGIFDRLVTAEHQAFRQRWSIGWDPPVDPKTKEPDPRATFRASRAALWTFQGDTDKVKVGEFAQAEFDHFIKADQSDVNAAAAISKTPPHYLLGAIVNISGDAIAAAESGIVLTAEKQALVLSDPIEEFERLGLQAEGSPAANDRSSMVIWGPFERRSWAEQIDGIIKLRAAFPEVPSEELWPMIPGMTPQDVARWKALAVSPPKPAAPAAPAAPQESAPRPGASVGAATP